MERKEETKKKNSLFTTYLTLTQTHTPTPRFFLALFECFFLLVKPHPFSCGHKQWAGKGSLDEIYARCFFFVFASTREQQHAAQKVHG